MAFLRYTQDGTPFEVTLDTVDVTVGRSDDCVLQIHGDGEISRLHCAIQRRDEDCFVILDSSSRNGTFVNDTRLMGEARELEDGDRIKIGNTLLVFHDAVRGGKMGTDDLFAEIARKMDTGKGFNTMMHEILEPEQAKTDH